MVPRLTGHSVLSRGKSREAAVLATWAAWENESTGDVPAGRLSLHTKPEFLFGGLKSNAGLRSLDAVMAPTQHCRRRRRLGAGDQRSGR
jgi:hypothetical protein